ncbi:glutathione S-transferase family protein [Rhizobium sp. L1K21]|uniref:glutathione S-transferase family protein n=1 Tax=Rhizobium sp. L1K21 TaxID=2954933 RepID=UPI0020925E19|nr:glutathione S-transferase [Rhizobium sp. L1K21]MCO6186239.1 glutathione S-transferase [Rhizobium sp. L1K21]
MKLFDGGRAPNPRRVDIFLREKGIEIERVPVDMGALGHKAPEITALNPLQRLPVLQLDDGTVICESVAICRYFEEIHPEPNLFGATPLERAQVEMWNRRAELSFLGAVAAAFRHIHPAMKEWEVPQVPEWGEVNKPKAVEFLIFLNSELAGRDYIAGDRFTIADITMAVGFDFMKPARITCPPELENVLAWHQRVAARPSMSVT